MHVQKQHSYHIWIKFGKMVRIPDILPVQILVMMVKTFLAGGDVCHSFVKFYCWQAFCFCAIFVN